MSEILTECPYQLKLVDCIFGNGMIIAILIIWMFTVAKRTTVSLIVVLVNEGAGIGIRYFNNHTGVCSERSF